MSATACHENEFRNQLIWAFSGYTIDSECTSWEPIGGICKPASWGGAPGSNHILSNIMASIREQNWEAYWVNAHQLGVLGNLEST